MGGLGSGRTGGNPTVNVSPTITIPLLFKGERLRVGLRVSGQIDWTGIPSSAIFSMPPNDALSCGMREESLSFCRLCRATRCPLCRY